ncbi:MAG: class I SAM-dependent methyltransferase [Thalassobaculales bacterium]
MSRLVSFIARLEAQRRCLDHAAGLVAGLAGPVLELGLGNGRTYDHLRAGLPGRRIIVFERQVAAHPDCVPPDGDLVLGDLERTLPGFRPPAPVALIHADIGSGHDADDRCFAARLAPLLAGLLAPGGVLAGDQPFPDPALVALPLPAGVAAGRYHLYRRS